MAVEKQTSFVTNHELNEHQLRVVFGGNGVRENLWEAITNILPGNFMNSEMFHQSVAIIPMKCYLYKIQH